MLHMLLNGFTLLRRATAVSSTSLCSRRSNAHASTFQSEGGNVLNLTSHGFSSLTKGIKLIIGLVKLAITMWRVQKFWHRSYLLLSNKTYCSASFNYYQYARRKILMHTQELFYHFIKNNKIQLVIQIEVIIFSSCYPLFYRYSYLSQIQFSEFRNENFAASIFNFIHCLKLSSAQ